MRVYKVVVIINLVLFVPLVSGAAGCNSARTQTVTKDVGLQGRIAPAYSRRVQSLPFRSRDNAIDSEKKGVMQADDYAMLMEIGGKTADKLPLSDADLDFALHQVQSGPLKNVGNNQLEHYRIALGSLTGPKKLTPNQVTRFLAVVVPLATGNDRAIQGFAVPALASTHDARVLPVLEKIVRESSDTKMRQFAGGNILRLKEALLNDKAPKGRNR